jgi:hypothetical protein
MKHRWTALIACLPLLVLGACGEPLVEVREPPSESGETASSLPATTAAATSGETTAAVTPVTTGVRPRNPSPSELGACPPELAPFWDPVPLFMALEAWDWMEVDTLGEPGDAQDLVADQGLADEYWAVTLSGVPLSLGAPSAGRYLVRREAFDLAGIEVEGGASLILAVGRDDPYVKLIASIRDDGTIAFVGRCLYTYWLWLDDVVTATRPIDPSATSEVVLRELIADPRGALYQAYEQVRRNEAAASTWENRAADQRSLNPAETPPEVLDALETVSIAFFAPTSWSGFDGQLCTKTSLGWNGCVGFAFSGYGVVTYVVPGEDLELWLLNSDAEPRSPLGLLGLIPYASLVAGIRDQDQTVPVTIASADSVGSQAELIRSSEAGRVHLRIGG